MRKKSLLQKGLKFAGTPATIPIKEYISSTTVAPLQAGELNGVDGSSLYHDVNRILNTYTNKPILTTIPKAEHLALENLRKDKDPIIVAPEKGVALVVMDNAEPIKNVKPFYKTTQLTTISPKTHLQLSTKSSLKLCMATRITISSLKQNTTLLRPHGSNSLAERFYDLPKMHKNNVPMHPMVSTCGNSINPEEETLVSFDVSALFTSIPVLVALQVINSKISTCTSFSNVCKIPTDKFIKLLKFTITNCIFCFNKKCYKQLQCAAMGSPVSLAIANIYMECFESLAIPTSLALIKCWFRYVDDVHSVTRKDQVNKLEEHLNSIDPYIKFTIELTGTDGQMDSPS